MILLCSSLLFSESDIVGRLLLDGLLNANASDDDVDDCNIVVDDCFGSCLRFEESR